MIKIPFIIFINLIEVKLVWIKFDLTKLNKIINLFDSITDSNSIIRISKLVNSVNSI